LRFALICLIAAIAVLVIFYFLNTGTKMRAVAAPDMPSSSSMGVPAPAAT